MESAQTDAGAVAVEKWKGACCFEMSAREWDRVRLCYAIGRVGRLLGGHAPANVRPRAVCLSSAVRRMFNSHVDMVLHEAARQRLSARPQK